MDLPRRLPDPMPTIHPVPEYEAVGSLAAEYEDVKRVLQVPWMGVVTMAFAHYPNFFAELWRGVRPLCESEAFVAACHDLQDFTQTGVSALDPPPIASRLTEKGYGQREIEAIREMIEVFSHGNFPYVPIATIVRMLLAGEALSNSREAELFEGRHAPEVSVPFILMERHHADAPTRALYDDVMATLGLPFVNTDYRALARWPSYFALAWSDLKPVVTTDAHKAFADAVYARAIEAVRGFPNPGVLSPEGLIAAAELDAPLDEVRAVAQLFHTLLPGLVVNVAFFRAQLL